MLIAAYRTLSQSHSTLEAGLTKLAVCLISKVYTRRSFGRWNAVTEIRVYAARAFSPATNI